MLGGHAALCGFLIFLEFSFRDLLVEVEDLDVGARHDGRTVQYLCDKGQSFASK